MLKTTGRAWIKNLLFLAIVGSFTLLVAANREQIRDWWFFLRYQPSASVATLANAAGMNDQGKQLFYRADPQLVDQLNLEQVCDREELGCITETGQIYILNQPSQTDRQIVTVAHEMLHMAYRRLPDDDRQTLHPLLTAETTNYVELLPRLSRYPDQAEQLDELHSILGSEYQTLSAELEQHYRRYFKDRSLTAKAYQRSH